MPELTAQVPLSDIELMLSVQIGRRATRPASEWKIGRSPNVPGLQEVEHNGRSSTVTQAEIENDAFRQSTQFEEFK